VCVCVSTCDNSRTTDIGWFNENLSKHPNLG
jgi:hypothetical protein